MSHLSGLANPSRSLRVDAAADSSAPMNYGLGPAMTHSYDMKAVHLESGVPSAATLGYDLSRLLASKVICGDSSMTLQGGSGWGDSSSLSYPAMPGHGPSFSERGLTNSFSFGEGSNRESSQLELLLNHQRNLVLEEQIRRNLLSESLLSSQARSFAPSFGIGSVVRRDSNVLGGEGQSSIDRLNELLTFHSKQVPAVAPQARCANDLGSFLGRILSCPPVKKQRGDASKVADLLENIVKRHKSTKHRFPSPSDKQRRKVRIQDLAVLRERWRHTRERTATWCTDPRLKEAFDKELFARSLIRSNSQSLEGRLEEVTQSCTTKL